MSQALMEKNADGVYELKLPEVDPVVELHATGVLDKFAGTDIVGLPVGGATIGVGLVATINALVARFVPAQTAFLTGPIGKLALAWVAKQYLAKPLGRKSADAIAFVLVADTARGYVEPLISNALAVKSVSQSSTTSTVSRSAVNAGFYSGIAGRAG